MTVSDMHCSVQPDNISWWYQDAMAAEGDIKTSQVVQGVHRADVVVVGGGFTGLWTALRLREKDPKLKVMLLEAKRCGSGASGMNGGVVSGYWGALSMLASSFGDQAALEIAKLGSRAHESIRIFSMAGGRDVWWHESGNIRVACSNAQEAKNKSLIATAARLGASDSVIPLSREALVARLRSPLFRSGVFFPEGATIHPARLARALRLACIEAGVLVHENTPMVGIDDGVPCRVRLKNGEIITQHVILATNAALSGNPHVAPYLALFSSYAVISEPIENLDEIVGWEGAEGIADLRMFIHYFRKAGNDRILMGSGSGSIAFGRQYPDNWRLSRDTAAAERARHALYSFFPGLNAPAIEKAWGGPLDVSADRLPFFTAVGSGRIYVGCGYSGHGINATRIGGECLSSLVLGEKNDWTRSFFCQRALSRYPREPFKTLGGRLVRAAIMKCEEAEDKDQGAPMYARLGAWLPRGMNIKVGLR